MSIVRHDVHMLKTRTAAMEAVRLRNELQATELILLTSYIDHASKVICANSSVDV